MLSPRDYQKAIFETAKNKNTLVVLPTGLGKTLIALLLSKHHIETFPSKKVLFLAPTKPLVEQHFEYYKKNLSEMFAEIEIFTGAVSPEKREDIWHTAEIIFSTPQCVANDLNNNLYDLKDVSLLIIDEAHRCLKNYDYTKVVNFFKEQSPKSRLLGLTASPGSDLSKVKEICHNLSIEAVEIRTRESDDVKEYLQEAQFEKRMVPFPDEFVAIKLQLKNFYDRKVNELRERSLLFGPANKITLLNLQRKLGAEIGNRNFNAMVGLSLCAQAIKVSHAIELLETQTLSGLNDYLQKINKEAKEKKSKASQVIANSIEFQNSMKLISLCIENKIEHPKIEELKVMVESELAENEKAKIIIFTQFRETASTIKNKLLEIQGARPKLFVGQAKKNDTGLSQKEQKEIIDEFKLGTTNILCSTSIGEEGLDIPEVNAVFLYEPVASEIRKIQRAGRTARMAPGKIIALVTKDTRDETYHYASSAREKKMHSSIQKVKTEMKNRLDLSDFQ